MDSTGYSIADTSIMEFMNSDIMQGIRARMLDGDEQSMCSACRYQDANNKVSGRQRQLLKSAIRINRFDQSFCSSPHWNHFEYSYQHHGLTQMSPVDLQIDLGNTCNSACVMCSPIYSSRLAADYVKLNSINPNLFAVDSISKNWTDDPKLVDKFIDELTALPNIKYIHFLGGETLYLRSFYTICNRLIELGVAKNISIGTTTNCTIYTDELEHIIENFKNVHLGLSVEALHPVNDYIRYPSKHAQVALNIAKFLELRRQKNLQVSLRITPSILSIIHLDTLFELMLDEKIVAESCDILHDPSCLRLELLPLNLKKIALDKITNLIKRRQLTAPNGVVVNQRREDLVDSVITQVIFEYKNLLETLTEPGNIEQERYNLVNFIKAFEQVRSNKILDYLPEYEEFLRSYGY